MRLEYFQMVDRIAHFDPDGRRVEVSARVPDESPVFAGHFPGHPLMPGVLLIETMAQTSGWLILGLSQFVRMPFLVGVKEAKLRSFVAPGRALAVEARIDHEGSGYTVTRAAIRTDGERVCDAELLFRLMPFPDATLERAMRDRGVELGLLAQEPAGG
jgi:3-hydroxyacyl-[acyl-carrier-protein] dehydratase